MGSALHLLGLWAPCESLTCTSIVARLAEIQAAATVGIPEEPMEVGIAQGIFRNCKCNIEVDSPVVSWEHEEVPRFDQDSKVENPMKVKTRLGTQVLWGDSVLEVLEQIRKQADLPEDCVRIAPGLGSLRVCLDFVDPRLALLRDVLVKAGIDWWERKEHVYTRQELLGFPLLEMSVGVHGKAAGPDGGTKYDFGPACPGCGTGARQTSPLTLKASDFPRKAQVCALYTFEMLFRGSLVNALRAAKVTGADFREAVNRRGAGLDWYQLAVRTTLPPFSKESQGITRDDPCQRCGRNGYYNSSTVPTELVYRREDLAGVKLTDFAQTYECFGYSLLPTEDKPGRFAHPLVLIRPRVLQVFQQQKVRHLHFDPVRIV